MPVALDLPNAQEPSDPLSLRVQGWVYAERRHSQLLGVEIEAGGKIIGRSTLLYPRNDVSNALAIGRNIPTGFTLLCAAPEAAAAREVTLSVHACFADGAREQILERTVPLTGRDYRSGDWGILVNEAFPHLVHREQMYNSGPSLDAGNPETLALLQRYLPPAPARLIDVGCGRGYYGQALQSDGYDWFGVEIKAEDCAALAQKQLPHRQVDGGPLPFAVSEFDAALCIEVLEHVPNPWSFIADVRRVLKRRLLISVPNLEVVPYWRPHHAVPWHLLEADHRNFFSRASLRALLQPHFRHIEIIGYGPAPLRTAEGAAIDYHLFAIAEA